MRRDVSFRSVGLRCSGSLYVPDGVGSGRRAPAIILACGFAGEKEMHIAFAEAFARAGFAALVFDYRHWGDSEGEPRNQLFPLDEVEDVRNAITWTAGQPEVDATRVSLWGTSFGGGIVVHAATFDRRVKAVVAQVPYLVDIETRFKEDPEGWTSQGEFLQRDRTERYTTGRVSYFQIVSAKGEPCVLPGQETYDEYQALVRDSPKQPPTWRNEVTLESLEKIREFDPVQTIPLLSPTPFLIVAGQHDSLVPMEVLREVQKRAGGNATLKELPIEHFEVYAEPWRSRAAAEEIDWLKQVA